MSSARFRTDGFTCCNEVTDDFRSLLWSEASLAFIYDDDPLVYGRWLDEMLVGPGRRIRVSQTLSWRGLGTYMFHAPNLGAWKQTS